MLVVETIARIRRDHLVRGVPIKTIARDLRVSKNTVRKVVRGDETSYSYARKIQPMPKLGPWVGYGVTEGLFTAAEVGAPHRRQRLFVLAHAEGVLGQAVERRQPARPDAGLAYPDRRQPPRRAAGAGTEDGGRPHDQLRRSDAGLADAEGVRRPQAERGQAADGGPQPSGPAVADAERAERRSGQPAGNHDHRTRAGRKQETDRSRRGRSRQRATLDDADGPRSQGRSDDPRQHAGERPAWPPGPEDRDGWERFLRCAPDLEPAVRRGADGLACRVDRLRLCGNGVVPLVAAHAWRTLKARFDRDA